MTDDDPNEAYEVVPIEQGPHGPPKGWWTVKRNGLPVKHFPARKRLSGMRPIRNIGKPCHRESLGEGEEEIVRARDLSRYQRPTSAAWCGGPSREEVGRGWQHIQ
jgi:hypothetical protein